MQQQLQQQLLQQQQLAQAHMAQAAAASLTRSQALAPPPVVVSPGQTSGMATPAADTGGRAASTGTVTPIGLRGELQSACAERRAATSRARARARASTSCAAAAHATLLHAGVRDELFVQRQMTAGLAYKLDAISVKLDMLLVAVVAANAAALPPAEGGATGGAVLAQGSVRTAADAGGAATG